MKRLSAQNLESLLDRWLDRDIRPSTAQAYKKWLRQFIVWYSRRKTPITVSLVVDYKHDSLQTLSPRTVRNRLAALRGFCAYLTKAGVLNQNPVLEIRAPRIDTQRHAREALTIDQAQSLLQLVSTSGSKRDSAILHLVVLQGLRVAEVSRLNRSDIKKLDGVWTIDIQGKGMDGKITQPLQPQTVRALLEWMAIPGRSNELFLARSGVRCSPDRISRVCKQWLRRSGLDDSRITAHSLRHTFATLILSQGGRLEIASKMLRHANLATTMIYAHIDRTAVSNQFQALGSILSDGKSQ